MCILKVHFTLAILNAALLVEVHEGIRLGKLAKGGTVLRVTRGSAVRVDPELIRARVESDLDSLAGGTNLNVNQVRDAKTLIVEADFVLTLGLVSRLVLLSLNWETKDARKLNHAVVVNKGKLVGNVNGLGCQGQRSHGEREGTHDEDEQGVVSVG